MNDVKEHTHNMGNNATWTIGSLTQLMQMGNS